MYDSLCYDHHSIVSVIYYIIYDKNNEGKENIVALIRIAPNYDRRAMHVFRLTISSKCLLSEL